MRQSCTVFGRYYLCVSILVVLMLFSNSYGVDRISVSRDRDTTYLEYSYYWYWGEPSQMVARPQQRLADVLTPAVNDTMRFNIIRGYNQSYGSPDSAYYGLFDRPSVIPSRQLPVPVILSDWTVFTHAETGRPAVIGCGIRHDSAFAYLLDTESGDYREQPVEWYDGDRDPVPSPFIRLLAVTDADFDGMTDVVLSIRRPRSEVPGKLVFLEAESLRVRGERIISHNPTREPALVNHDSVAPSIFMDLAPAGQSDPGGRLAPDSTYLGVFDFSGKMLVSYAVGGFGSGVQMAFDPAGGHVYVAHDVPLDSGLTMRQTGTGYLTRLDGSGAALTSRARRGQVRDCWTEQYDERAANHLYVLDESGVIRVYDSTLVLVAESDTTHMQGGLLGRLKIVGRPDSVLVFSDGLYSIDLEWLASFPELIQEVAPVAGDSDGYARTLLLGTHNSFSIGFLQRRGTPALISIFLKKHQRYVLMVLTALIVGVLLINHYRRRARSHMRLIAQQKAALEKAHSDLKEAQEKIVAQEKFQQARDIAGGFAHEIRNALFPAEAAMVRMSRKLPPDTDDRIQRYLNTIDTAVNRSLDITELISLYTKLESEFMPESVDPGTVFNEVLDANRIRIEEQGVKVVVEKEPDLRVVSNSRQLNIVYNNLLLNALDALTDVSDGRIVVALREGSDGVSMRFQDNGAGIGDDQRNRVFETFFSTKGHAGKGLGLAITRKIIMMYDGDIKVESEPGQGTTFQVLFRAATKNAASDGVGGV